MTSYQAPMTNACNSQLLQFANPPTHRLTHNVNPQLLQLTPQFRQFVHPVAASQDESSQSLKAKHATKKFSRPATGPGSFPATRRAHRGGACGNVQCAAQLPQGLSGA